MVRFFWICLGGAIGTGARYLISDTQDQIDRLIPILDEMVEEGLVTLEKARASSTRRANVRSASPGSREIRRQKRGPLRGLRVNERVRARSL